MTKAELTVEETKAMLLYVAAGMVASKDVLTHADQAIGDGDHGIGMARGFAVVQQRLSDQPFETIDGLFKAAGTALMTSIGGAAGAIFGTLFLRGAGNSTGQTVFDSAMLSRLLNDGLQAVKERGKAKLGDKTIVDALEPAALKSIDMTARPLSVSLAAAADSALQGMEKTKELIATVGKAKTLGERSRGYPDPGALSMYLILKFMSEYAAG
ncbi:MAG: dihydroxyacetone kinase subunit DhaL [Chloroflexi bacterium]|nr:dihydroxyacetone kinase subunit DhaL [Chloroflexota bacterium]